MPGGPHRYYFGNLRVLPVDINGVRLIRGVELNILNEAGEVDLPNRYLSMLDVAWAGLHALCFDGSGEESYTKAVLKAIKNPYIDGIVHPGNPDFPLDAEEVVLQAREYGKILEINNSSFQVRYGSYDPCLRFASLAAHHGVMIAVNSDAHFAFDVGRKEKAVEVLEKAALPEDLIVNNSLEKVEAILKARQNRLENM